MPIKDPEKRRAVHAKYMKDVWYPANKKKHMKLVKARAKRKALETAEWIRNYKASVGCVDCGENDHRVLDFDHVNGTKILAVATLLSKKCSLAKIKREIEKCEVRCANCHRKVTYNRREGSLRRSGPVPCEAHNLSESVQLGTPQPISKCA